MEEQQMMAVLQGRRSIRRFSAQPLARELLTQLVVAACWAPSGSNAQAWQYVAVDDPEKLARLTAFLPGVLAPPPALICLCLDRERETARAGQLGEEVLGVMDLSMAAQNIMLYAHCLGLGSCAVRGFHPTVVRTALALPPQVTPELIIVLGYPAQQPKAPARRPLEEVLHWNVY